MKTNYHTHTTFCDGADTPEQMCEAAIVKGFKVLGFSSHSDMVEDMPAYRARILNLRELYRGRIEVKLGIEMEMAKPWVDGEFDYVIGSVHYITASDGTLLPIDHSVEKLEAGVREHFDGDSKSYVKEYFAALRNSLTAAYDVVGHPDLVRKFNARHPYFDEQADWYLGEIEATADAIAASGKIVEINTGAISRGWLDEAYPSPFFRQLLRSRGVRLLYSSDAHTAQALDCAYERFKGEANCETLGYGTDKGK